MHPESIIASALVELPPCNLECILALTTGLSSLPDFLTLLAFSALNTCAGRDFSGEHGSQAPVKSLSSQESLAGNPLSYILITFSA